MRGGFDHGVETASNESEVVEMASSEFVETASLASTASSASTATRRRGRWQASALCISLSLNIFLSVSPTYSDPLQCLEEEEFKGGGVRHQRFEEEEEDVKKKVFDLFRSAPCRRRAVPDAVSYWVKASRSRWEEVWWYTLMAVGVGRWATYMLLELPCPMMDVEEKFDVADSISAQLNRSRSPFISGSTGSTSSVGKVPLLQ